MRWHCVFLYIDNIVSLTNLMLSDYRDRDRVYLFQLEIKRIPQIQLGLLHVLAYSLYCQLGSVENKTCHDLNVHIVSFPDNIPVALHKGCVSLNRYLVFPIRIWVLQTNKAVNSYRENLNKYRFLIIFDKLPIRWTCSRILPQL